MPTPNYWSVYERLTADEALSPRSAALVEAALHDDASFAYTLEHTDAPPPLPSQTPEPPPARPAGAYLQRLEVERFRGIGPKAVLNLTPGPGLTVVVGRNGSGKSSLAEGLETLLTGRSLRWADRKPKEEWQSGWRNLHDPGVVHLSAKLVVEGRPEPVVLTKRWAPEEELGAATLDVRQGARPLRGLGSLGWTDALESCRPFLSYNELGRALEAGPAKLFDALEGLLGLEDVAAARERLRQARLASERRLRDHKRVRKQLLDELGASRETRAKAALGALSPRNPDLDELESLLLTVEESTSGEHERALRQLAALRLPDELPLLEACDEVRASVEDLARLADSDSERALKTAQLLEQALAVDVPGESTCPVCGTPEALTEAWHTEALARSRSLRTEAEAAHQARQRLESAVRTLRTLHRSLPRPAEHAVDEAVGARAAYARWCELPEGPLMQVAHVEACWPELRRCYEAVSAAASTHLGTLQQAWRPLQQRLGVWLDEARDLEAHQSDLDALRHGEDWLKAVEQDLRDEAFTPIADQAQATWNALRQQSNVQLARPKLAGTAQKRTVQLDITVDGTGGVALGVMSQGELHALALSLFLPRLTRPDSPFRFVVVDDPVQAMDPAKVEGLARVLDDAAQTHQVVVFTHDARLPAAIRRLGIGATVTRVERHTDSRVEVKPAFDTVQQHIADASHLESQRDRLGDEVVRTVVPGLCRAAVEAALLERLWREELGKGRAHAEIEGEVAEAKGLHDLAALAFFGSRTAGGKVMARLGRMGPWAADQFAELKAHAHAPLPPHADVRAFIYTSGHLARRVSE